MLNRKQIVQFAVVFIFAMPVGIAICEAKVADQKTPNFVFVLVDDQAWNGLSVPMIQGKDYSRNRGISTPNIENIAKNGMTFSQAYAAHPKCECSRAAILMGRSTTSLNAPDKSARNWNAPPSDSIANTLKRANPAYRAAHLGKWQWFHTPASMGYDVSDGITMNEDGDTNDPEDPKQSFSITRRASDFMQQQVQDGHPFYLQLSYYAVHAIPQALASTKKKYEGLGGAPGGRGDQAIMAAMLDDFDRCIGDVMKRIDSLGIAENTFVIFMSDNGGPTRFLKGGKGNLGEGGIRVPLIVKGPGINGGFYCNEPVVSYDILPTVVDLAHPGFGLPDGVEGGSWKPLLLNNGTGKVQRPFDRLVFHQPVENEHPQSAIRKGDYKLLYSWDVRESELYNLVEDLSESHDLSKVKPEITAQLQKELIAHVRAGLGDQAVANLQSGIVVRGGGKGPAKGKGPGGGPKGGKRPLPPQ